MRERVNCVHNRPEPKYRVGVSALASFSSFPQGWGARELSGAARGCENRPVGEQKGCRSRPEVWKAVSEHDRGATKLSI